MKKCRKCGVLKPLTDFHKNPKCRDGRASWCKHCAHKQLAESRKNPEAKNRHKEYARNHSLRQRYGLSRATYDLMEKIQNGSCMICKGVNTKRKLAVDHCHATGKVRSLLCDKCNRGLGFFDHSIRKMKLAIAYMEVFNGEENEN